MQLIPITPPAIPPAAIREAESELAHINSAFTRAVEYHKERFAAFWDNPHATPDELLTLWGTRAQQYLAAASGNANLIATLASSVGKTIDDFLPPDYYVPRREFIFQEDGTVTLAPPADGYDLHGKLIPIIEEEPPIIEEEGA